MPYEFLPKVDCQSGARCVTCTIHNIYNINVRQLSKADYTRMKATPERIPVRTAMPAVATEFPVVFDPLLVVTVAQGTIGPVYVVVNVLDTICGPLERLFPVGGPAKTAGSMSSSTQTPSPFDVSRLQLDTTPK